MTTTALESRNDLPGVERALLTCMRSWMYGCQRGIVTHERIQAIFASLHSSRATEYLDGLMRALNEGCTRMIEVRCLCDTRLSGDEAVLLDGFALEQGGRDADATTALRSFVNPLAASAAAGHALGVVQILNGAGYFLSREPPSRDVATTTRLTPPRKPSRPKRLN